jgi:hypothetical protein
MGSITEPAAALRQFARLRIQAHSDTWSTLDGTGGQAITGPSTPRCPVDSLICGNHVICSTGGGKTAGKMRSSDPRFEHLARGGQRLPDGIHRLRRRLRRALSVSRQTQGTTDPLGPSSDGPTHWQPTTQLLLSLGPMILTLCPSGSNTVTCAMGTSYKPRVRYYPRTVVAAGRRMRPERSLPGGSRHPLH